MASLARLPPNEVTPHPATVSDPGGAAASDAIIAAELSSSIGGYMLGRTSLMSSTSLRSAAPSNCG
eukprot:scaffold10670_cov142-Isochrysis_galbana.AAC.2